jgi:hypothetical protein
MSKGEWSFKPRDFKRLVWAAEEVGLRVSGVRREPDGSIYLDTSPPEAKPGALERQT